MANKTIVKNDGLFMASETADTGNLNKTIVKNDGLFMEAKTTIKKRNNVAFRNGQMPQITQKITLSRYWRIR